MSGTRVPERLRWGVEQLPPVLDTPVLEIGCGAGHAVDLLLTRYPGTSVTAIDRSPTQIARARARLATKLTSDPLRLEPLELYTAPRVLGLNRFGIVLAINVNAFWTDPVEAFGAAADLLAPGGQVYLVYEAPNARQRQRLQATVPELASDRSFRVADVRTARGAGFHGICVVAERR